MTDELPQIGTNSYNGVFFSVNTETLNCSGLPVMDQQARRTVSYVVWRLHIKTTVIAELGSNTDLTLDDIRNRLTTAGGALEYADKGFGDLTVNIGDTGPNKSTKRDVKWGPIPLLVSWKPIASNRAAEVQWMVEVAVPQCDHAVFQGQLMAYNYSVRYTQDGQGYTTRTITGYIEIPMTRKAVDDRSIPDNVDNYWPEIYPLCPGEDPNDDPDNPTTGLGWKRMARDRIVSPDRRRLDFTVVDEEMPIPLQPDVTDCKASHIVYNSGNSIWGRYHNTLQATYMLSKKVSKDVAWTRFVELANARMSSSSSFMNIDPERVAAMMIPTNFVLEEPDIFGRPAARFLYSWTSVYNISHILQQSGLWTPLDKDLNLKDPQGNPYVLPATATYSLWKASMKDVLFGRKSKAPYGIAQATSDETDEIIVDLCIPPPDIGRDSTGNVRDVPVVLQTTVLPLQVPDDPAKSFINYEMSLRLKQKGGITAAMKRMSSTTIDPVNNNNTQNPPPPLQNQTIPYWLQNASAGTVAAGRTGRLANPMIGDKESAGKADIFQVRTQATRILEFRGRALAFGWPINIPQLFMINAAKQNVLVPLGGPSESGVVGYFGAPLYGASWIQEYALPFTIPPEPIGTPANVMPGSASFQGEGPTMRTTNLDEFGSESLSPEDISNDYTNNPDPFNTPGS
jgi:hypothetical protein